MHRRVAKLVGAALVASSCAGCGDSGGSPSSTGSTGASGSDIGGGPTTTSATADGPSTSASSSTPSGTDGAGATAASGASTGGDGGASPGSGGASGAGGSSVACVPPPLRVAAGDDFTCALADDGSGACRGGPFGEAWLPIELAGDAGPTRCLDQVVAQGAIACVHVGRGDDCPTEGFRCLAQSGNGWLPFGEPGDARWLAITGSEVCGYDDAGSPSCRAGTAPPDLGPLVPLGGISGGPTDTCAWSEAGIVCWGDTTSLAAEAPTFPGCVADVDVGPGFACAAYTGLDVVDCWGELPRGIQPRLFLPAPGADIAVGDAYVCVRTLGSLVRCWGDNADGALGVQGIGGSEAPIEPTWPGPAPQALVVTAGSRHVALLEGGGAILAWGANDASQVCDCGDPVTTPTDTSFPQP